MKIKRFLAPDMRTALQHVRQEHGPDAVILSNRTTPEGIEIVAASQYDEDMVHAALENDTTTVPAATPAATTELDSAPTPASSTDTPPAPAPQPPFTASIDLPEPAASPAFATLLTTAVASAPATTPPPVEISTPAPMSTNTAPVQDTAPAVPEPTRASPETRDLLPHLREEFAQLRQLLERGLDRITDERLRLSPARQQFADWMEEQGFAPAFIRELAPHIPSDGLPHQIQSQAMNLITECLPISPSNLLDEGGVIALVGPSGAGKTTIVGKLAAHYSVRHGVRDIAIISLDHARPGGSDRLYSLARQLGIAVHEADSSQSLATLLQWLQDYHLILIDTAGIAPHDPQAAEQLDWLRAAEAVRSLLVLPANTHHADLADLVQRFKPARPQGAVLTKLDETRRPGGVLSVIAEQQLPLTWVSDGQHLHDDLHRADASRLLLRLSAIAAEAPYDPVTALIAPQHACA